MHRTKWNKKYKQIATNIPCKKKSILKVKCHAHPKGACLDSSACGSDRESNVFWIQ